MRWPTAFILAYVLLGLQVGVSQFVAFHGAAPNLGLIAVLFIAMHMRKDSALLAAFAIGFVQDLLSMQQPGLYAFSYGLVAMLIVSAHRMVNAEHPLSHVVLALFGGFITCAVLLAHSMVHPAASAGTIGTLAVHSRRISAGVEFTRIVYTAALSPVVLGIVQRLRNSLKPARSKRRW